jgi:hypothetical protein
VAKSEKNEELAMEFQTLEEDEEWGRDILQGEQVLVEGLRPIGRTPVAGNWDLFEPIPVGDATQDDLDHARILLSRWNGGGEPVVRYSHKITPKP